MALTGSTTALTRFYVEGKLPEDFWETVQEKIKERSFTEFTGDTTDLSTSGWVSFDDMFDYSFEKLCFRKPPFFVISLRVDTRSVPAKLVTPLYTEATKKLMQEAGRAYLTRDEKHHRVDTKARHKITDMAK